MNRHKKIHLGSKPHACLVSRCNRSGNHGFARKDHLRQHLRQVHGIYAWVWCCRRTSEGPIYDFNFRYAVFRLLYSGSSHFFRENQGLLGTFRSSIPSLYSFSKIQHLPSKFAGLLWRLRCLGELLMLPNWNFRVPLYHHYLHPIPAATPFLTASNHRKHCTVAISNFFAFISYANFLATLFIIFLTFSVGMEADVLFVLSLRTTLNILTSTHMSSCVELSCTNDAGHPVLFKFFGKFFFFWKRGNPSLEPETYKNSGLMNEWVSQLHTKSVLESTMTIDQSLRYWVFQLE